MTATNNKYVAVVEIFAPFAGILESVDMEILYQDKDVHHIVMNRNIDDEVGRASDGCAFILKFLVQKDSYEKVEKESIRLFHALHDTLRITPLAS